MQYSAMTGWNSPEMNADTPGMNVSPVVTDEPGQRTRDGSADLLGVNAQRFSHDSVPRHYGGQWCSS